MITKLMKYSIICLFFAALGACQEDDPAPLYVDPFVGSWRLDTVKLNLDIEISFDVSQGGDGLSFRNIKIEYPEIKEPESLDYHIEAHKRFAVNAGYEQIQIFASSEEEWIIINMDRSIIHLKSSDKMDVYRMEINMINRIPIELENQVFVKTPL